MNNYSGPERRMEDPWRTAMEGRVSVIENDLRGIKGELSENTRVTKDVGTKVDALSVAAKPAIEMSGKVTKGFEVVGWIGTAAEWLARKWIILVAIAIAVKILVSGGTWSEVVQLFKDIPP